MPIAVIAFDFDPLLRLAEGLVVRWQTLALAAAIAATLILAGLIARRATLRADDLLFIAVGTVPGAVIAGRLGYVLLHFDYYAANPGAILDPGLGAMELALGVVGGLLTGSYVASLLGAPVGRWWHAAVLPLLLVLGVGKLTMILGGAGQGTPSGAAWATAFLGPGPWGSLAPALPSDPSQAYEAIVTLVAPRGADARARPRRLRPARWAGPVRGHRGLGVRARSGHADLARRRRGRQPEHGLADRDRRRHRDAWSCSSR